jgi:biofilm PGA synthesis lipoprotein PgaB
MPAKDGGQWPGPGVGLNGQMVGRIRLRRGTGGPPPTVGESGSGIPGNRRAASLRRLRTLPLLLLGLVCALVLPLLPTPGSAVLGPAVPADPLRGLVVLAYHEVAEPGTPLMGEYAVTPAQFRTQIGWLSEHGHHFVSAARVREASSGGRPLPPSPVLLSFDDGYGSVYANAFPVLRDFHAPAVLALVGRWLEPESGLVDFGDQRVPRERFLSWDQLREMLRSGLVEVASHSYDLHHGIAANPQGNSLPAATTRAWSPAHGYESEGAYRARLVADLKANSDLLEHRLGVRPKVIVWPYGRYNDTATQVAAGLGMTMGLSLDDGANGPGVPLTALRRTLMEEGEVTLAGLERELALRRADAGDNSRAAKVMHVDLDNIDDPDPAQTERNLQLLLERIRAMGVNTVYLQAYADPDGNGAADALYFPNRQLPVKADLFSHVAWEIRTRTPVRRLYAWMPLLAFEFPEDSVPPGQRVVTQPSRNGHLAMGYPRLSPFAPAAMERVRQIYTDLSRYATFDGLLFHDDATLTDYEDASPPALRQYRAWGLPADLAAIRADDHLLGRWTTLKTDALEHLTLEMAARVRHNQPQLRTARNLYAQVVLNPHAESWYSQSLDQALRDYDFTAVMAMPFMERAEDPQQFLAALVQEVKQKPGGMDRVLFELQSTDWRSHQDLPSGQLAAQFAELYRLGARHVGYYPDNIHRGSPDPAAIRPVLASRSSAPELPR